MKISVEVDVLAHDAKSGVYHYLQRLLQATLALDQDNDYSLVYFGQPADATEFGLPLERVGIAAIRHFPRKLYNLLLRTPFAPPIDRLSRVSGDLFIFPGFVRWPLSRTKKSLVVVYDTAYIDHPEVLATRHFQRYLSWAVPRSITRATRVVTISQSTKQSLMSHYQTPAQKITVITPALDHDEFKPASQAQVDRVTAKFQIDRPYLLYIGTLEPRKNITGIVEAYLALPTELRLQYQLVLGGNRGWQSGEIERALSAVPAADLVITGYVASDDISALYSGAAAFIYPSLYEGWGMQVLEAMACGTPVITARNSSLPEVGAEAALYVDAQDTGALAETIQRVLTDPKLAADLVKQGKAQAAKFTWVKSAQKLKDLIEEIDRED